MSRSFLREWERMREASDQDQRAILDRLHPVIVHSAQLHLVGKAFPSVDSPNCEFCGKALQREDTMEIRGHRLRTRGICYDWCFDAFMKTAPGGTTVLDPWVKVASGMRGHWINTTTGEISSMAPALAEARQFVRPPSATAAVPPVPQQAPRSNSTITRVAVTREPSNIARAAIADAVQRAPRPNPLVVPDDVQAEIDRQNRQIDEALSLPPAIEAGAPLFGSTTLRQNSDGSWGRVIFRSGC